MHISEARAQNPAVTQHVSNKLSLLSCLIVLKLSNIKFIKNTQVTKTVSYVSEGKHLGNKLHVYIRSVWQTHNIQEINLTPVQHWVTLLSVNIKCPEDRSSHIWVLHLCAMTTIKWSTHSFPLMSLIQISDYQMQVYREEMINATKHIIMQKKWIMIIFFYKRDNYY